MLSLLVAHPQAQLPVVLGAATDLISTDRPNADPGSSQGWTHLQHLQEPYQQRQQQQTCKVLQLANTSPAGSSLG